MEGRLSSITANVFIFRDICNVYIVRKGSSCVLIDFGTGRVLPQLSGIGIERVEAVLHTHHHRDQAQGDAIAVDAGIPIFVPRHERHLFDQVELYWSTKQLYDMVNVRNTYFTLANSVPVSAVLEDFRAITWTDQSMKVLPTPGHTVGSITLLCDIDGVNVAFTGDLLHSPGTVHSLHDMQHAYAALDGIEAAALSLRLLKEKAPDILCPSHGVVMCNAPEALSSTEANLRSYFHLLSEGKPFADEYDFTRVNSRLLYASYANSCFYVLLSRDGKRTLFIDFGAANDAQFSPSTLRSEQGDTVRFFPHSVDRLSKDYGVETIEAVIPTHCHDDHICGIPYLIHRYGTEVWALDVMRDILENPAGELTGCVLPEPVEVTRILKNGERFSWEGLDFEVFHAPGHSEQHMSLFTEIDGKRVAFSGDMIWSPDFTPNIIYRNKVGKTSHQITAAKYLEKKPEVLCGGHGMYTDVMPESYERFFDKTRQLTGHFAALLPDDSGTTGLDPSWIRINPYQIAACPGTSVPVQVQIVNPFDKSATVEYRWELPSGWSAEPMSRIANFKIGESANQGHNLNVPPDYGSPFPKRLVVLDVTVNGTRLGQIAEAVVESAPYGPTGAGRPDIAESI